MSNVFLWFTKRYSACPLVRLPSFLISRFCVKISPDDDQKFICRARWVSPRSQLLSLSSLSYSCLQAVTCRDRRWLKLLINNHTQSHHPVDLALCISNYKKGGILSIIELTRCQQHVTYEWVDSVWNCSEHVAVRHRRVPHKTPK